MTMWLSVDPMADKYPSISPYAYCAWNPVKLVDPDGMEAIVNDDEWKVDRQKKTITRVGIKGGNEVQFVEGDGLWMRSESRGALLNEYDDYTVIDNTQGTEQLNPAEEKKRDDIISGGTVAGTLSGGVGAGCKKMSKALYDKDNGTYMRKDGTIGTMKQGKNGGTGGRYKTQARTAAKYAKVGRACTFIGIALALSSMDETEQQYKMAKFQMGKDV